MIVIKGKKHFEIHVDFDKNERRIVKVNGVSIPFNSNKTDEYAEAFFKGGKPALIKVLVEDAIERFELLEQVKKDTFPRNTWIVVPTFNEVLTHGRPA